jgi:hypothetical protein
MAEFREVLISWRDTPDDCFIATVGINAASNPLDEDDDNVFFWFADEAEFQYCLLNGEDEFTMEVDSDE